MAEIIRLDKEAESIQYLCRKDKRLAKVIQMVGPIEYSPYRDSYSFIVNQIIGQMLSNKVRDVIYGRLLVLCKDHLTAETISGLSDEEIRGIGISNAKVRYIRSFTEAMRQIDFDAFPQMEDEEIIKRLTKLPGHFCRDTGGPIRQRMYRRRPCARNAESGAPMPPLPLAICIRRWIWD